MGKNIATSVAYGWVESLVLRVISSNFWILNTVESLNKVNEITQMGKEHWNKLFFTCMYFNLNLGYELEPYIIPLPGRSKNNNYTFSKKILSCVSMPSATWDLL